MNRIRNLTTVTRHLTPALGEIRVTVEPEHCEAGLELRGRLHGPRSVYSSTVEVAYAVQPVVAKTGEVAGRLIVPDPCLWDPKNPFLYEGIVQLWQDGQMLDERPLRHGFRTVAIAKDGSLLINGRVWRLNGRTLEPFSAA